MSNFFNSSIDLRLKPYAKATSQIMNELTEQSANYLEYFKTDPVGYLASRLTPEAAERIPRVALNSANKFLFSILANKDFNSWLEAYNLKLTEEIFYDEFAELDEDKIRSDLAVALLEHGDPAILKALLDVPQGPNDPVQPNKSGCCCKKSDNDLIPEIPEVDPNGPTPVEGSPVVAVAVVVVVIAAVAVGVVVHVADVPPTVDLRRKRISSATVTAPMMVQIAENLTDRALKLREKKKI